MKRFNLWAKILADALLIACGMLVCACTAPSAFKIPFEANMLGFACLICGVLLSSWLHLPKYGVVPGLLFLGGEIIMGIIDRKFIIEGARVVWHVVAKTFSWDVSKFNVPEPVNGVAQSGAAVMSLLLVIAAVFGMLIAFSIIRCRHPLLPILIPIPPFLCGLIYTDHQPAFWTAFLLTVYCGGVLFGRGVRRRDSRRSGVITLAAMALLLGLSTLLWIVCPKNAYQPIPYERRQAVLGRNVEAAQEAILSWIGKNNPNEVDLKEEGDREQNTKKAFEVYATIEGTYLLRAHSYGAYQDGNWRAAEEYEGVWRSMKALGERKDGRRAYLSVYGAIFPERLVPYGFYPDANTEIGESSVRAQGKTSYLWTFYPEYTRDPHRINKMEQRYGTYAAQQYVMPDGEEKRAFLKILGKNGVEKSDDAYETAQRVASFVRASGTYTLTPGEVPDGADFVQFFLTESHQGYCVHFASATTALLQALEIPARYTVGYRVDVTEKETWLVVPELCAHAWTEIYLAGVGWIPIESTPGMTTIDVPLIDPGSLALVELTDDPEPPDEPIIPPSEETPEPTETPAPTETPKPQKTPVPDGTPKAEETPDPPEPSIGRPNDDGKKRGAWWLLLIIPIVPSGWIALGTLIRRRRTEKFRQPDARQAVIELYCYRKKLERFGVPPDPDAEEWADEAAFSKHDMGDARRELYKRIRALQNTLFMDKPFKQFIFRRILFIL